MEYLFTMLFGKSAAIGTAAMIAFSPPAIKQEGGKIVVMGKLGGIINQRVERIIRKGGTVNVMYDVSLVAYDKKTESVLARKFVHRIRYDRKGRQYIVENMGKKMVMDSKASASFAAGEYRVELPYKKKKAEYFDFYIEADIECDSSYAGALKCDPLWYRYRPMKSIKKIRADYLR